MALTIDELEIKIETKAEGATDGIDALVKTLGKLETAVSGSSKLVENLQKISESFKGISSVGKVDLASTIEQLEGLRGIFFRKDQAKNFSSIAEALTAFSSVPKVSFAPFVNGVKGLNDATKSFDDERLKEFSKQTKGIADGLAQLNTVGKSNIGSVLNQLKKIPDITKSLDPDTIDQFAAAIKRLTEILAPLASQMESVSKGFGLLPSRMKSTIRAANQVEASNARLGRSYNGLFTVLSRAASRFFVLYYASQRIIDVFAEAFNASNEYIESLNLFTVSMGDATTAAMDFAETVQYMMGIDVAEWITNQGVFQRMATGFGISAEQADIMSQNLTQLAYDMSSFFNTDVETAMQKLQSGMSGQIKGLKAWGYNLSVAALQETALSLGIEQSVRSMTEAQKAQLRYITLIQRSSGVMGDMARTINTPSNSLRILSAQMKQLERAFGNIVSVLATRVIPYVQAFVELAVEAADSFAKLMGFTIPKIDYSNLDMAADVSDGIGESLEDTEEKAKELKKQLMGFDELNILKSNDKDNKDDSLDYDLGFKMPEYNFLEGLSDEYREQIDEIKEAIREFGDFVSEYLIPIGTTLAGVFALSWIAGVITKFKKLKTVIAIADALTTAVGNIGWVFYNTGNIFKALGGFFTSLWASFKQFMSGLSPMTKALVAIIALVTEFVVVKNAVYDLATGSATLGETLLNVIPICAAVGAAMYAMLGPWGLVAAAVVGVTAAVVGYVQAENDMRAELSKDTFYDDQGVAIDELATAYGDLMQKVVEAQEPLLTISDNIDTARGSVENATEKVINLATQFELGYKTIEETVPLIKAEFDKLYNDTLDVLNNEAELIYTALAGSTGKALEDMGFNLEEVGLLIGAVVNNTTVDIERLKKENDELMDSIEAGTAGDGAMTKYLENAKKIAEMSGVDTSGLDDFKESLKNLIPDDINWETDDLSGIFDGIATSTKDAKDAVSETSDALIDSLNHLKSLTTDPEEIKLFDNLIAAFETDKENKLKEIEDMASEFVGNLQKNLITSVEDQYDAATENWDSMGWFKKIVVYGGDKEKYIKEFLDDYNENVVTPITDKMKTSFKESLGEDSVWADDAMGALLDNLFDNNIVMAAGGVTLKNNITDAINEVLPGGMRESGENAAQGLIDGVSSYRNKSNEIMAALGKDGLKAYDDVMKINSPSVEMEERGMYTMEGLANGVENYSHLVTDALADLIDAFMQMLSRFSTDSKQTVDNMLSSINKRLSGVKFNTIGVNVSPVMQYASGGFPNTGSMFIASEAGPELVGRIGNKTAVANNDQIIAGITSGVYNAMMAAHEDSNSSGGGRTTSRIVVQIGERVVGEAAVSYINGQIVQTGESPIYS